jgi:hypothetical protein
MRYILPFVIRRFFALVKGILAIMLVEWHVI